MGLQTETSISPGKEGQPTNQYVPDMILRLGSLGTTAELDENLTVNQLVTMGVEDAGTDFAGLPLSGQEQ